MFYRTPVKFLTKFKIQIPKSLKLYFLGSQFLFGIDFGFSSAVVNKRYQSLTKIFTLCLSLFWIIYLSVPLITISNDAKHWFVFIQYTGYFVVLNRAKYSAYNLISDINLMSKTSFQNKVKNLGYKLIALVTIMIFMKSIFMYTSCVGKEDDEFVDVLCTNTSLSYYFWVYNIPYLGMDVLPATQIVLIYYIRLGVFKLKEYLGRQDADLKIFRTWYLNLADCYDKINPLYDNMTFMEVVVGVPKMMMSLWAMLIYIQQNANFMSYLTELMFAGHNAMQIAAPAVLVEIVNSDVDAIKLQLKQRLLLCKDQAEEVELNRILQYIESRPLRHFAWRFIPLDVSLVTTLIGLCTTYFIVLIQFTHLYD